MSYLDSNVSCKILYTSVGSEILRIARTATDLINMVIRVDLLLTRMKKQKSECVRIISFIEKDIWESL